MLAIDIGNTNITLGIFRNGMLAKKAKIATRKYSEYRIRLKRFLANRYIEEAVVSSVVPDALARLKKALRKMSDCKILVLGEGINVPIKNLYRKKNEVGQDRLVSAFAAKEIYGAPAVIVDFGTAITFDIVSKRGEYSGGLILPGIGISLNALYEKTAFLPKVKLKNAPHIIGKDTRSSIRGGILFGFGAMADGLAAKYKKILGKNTKVIATGGNSRLLKKYATSIEIVDEDLTLKGLNLI